MYYLVRWDDHQFYTWDVIIEGRTPRRGIVVEQLSSTYKGKANNCGWKKGDEYNISTDGLRHIETVVAKDKCLEKIREKYYLELL